MNALAAWLVKNLPAYSYDAQTKTDSGVRVDDRWPDPDRSLPGRGVTILRAGPAADTETQPDVVDHEAIHDGISAVLRFAAPVDVATCCVVLNACAASYEAHRVDVVAHAATDATTAVTAPTAVDQTTAEALADDLRAVLVAHRRSSAHLHPDASPALLTLGPVTPGSTPLLIATTKALQAALSSHYVARIYLWRVAELDLPLQLDVWATNDTGRDDVMARLAGILHAGAGASTGDIDDDPVAQALTLTVGDGWTGAQAEVAFGAPSVTDTGESKQRDEYRATYRGTLTVARLVRAQSPRLTRAQLLLATSTGHAASATVARVGTTTTSTIVP
jgi:hypothetical protein